MHHHQGGTGSVLVNVGHLHLESGDIDRASTEAKKAFSLGDDKRDHILWLEQEPCRQLSSLRTRQ
jgi:hypothetical protein